MKRKYNIAVLGNGRIGRAVMYYLKKSCHVKRIDFLSKNSYCGRYDLLIGALPGELGKICLDLALKYKKDLIDISDVDPPDYLKKKGLIEKAGITVIPGCGFSPGLVNFILGRECLRGSIRDVEVKAGSLSSKKFLYPFLWCFEDIVLEHRIDSFQLIRGRKEKLPAFAGYRKESYFGMDAESYYCASGFENMYEKLDCRNFSVRVIRPYGFMPFFKFLESYGLLNKKNFMNTKNLLESSRTDNITLAEINISGKGKKIRWLIKGVSRKNETLNSMQKITASVPAVVAEYLLLGKIEGKGILFMEELAQREQLFKGVISRVSGMGIEAKRYD